MALARGLSTISTRKRKVTITKAKMAQYESDWRIHNKRCKQNGMHELRYSTLEDYIDYCHGRKKKTTKQEFQPLVTNTVYRREDNKQYPSLTKGGHGGGTKQEPMRYTGTLVTGIATMHKSNAVPVINQEQAEEISRMAK